MQEKGAALASGGPGEPLLVNKAPYIRSVIYNVVYIFIIPYLEVHVNNKPVSKELSKVLFLYKVQ